MKYLKMIPERFYINNLKKINLSIKNFNINNLFVYLQRHPYILYTILFVIFFVFIFSPFILYNKAYLWGSDGMSQHYPSLLYTKQWVESIISSIQDGTFSIPLWNLQLGFGQEVLGNAINFRIFNFLFIFFNESQLELYLFLRSLISLYLCGLSFLFFSKNKFKNIYSIILGSLLYTFSAFSLYFGARHPFFLEMMIYLPILLYGVDKIFEKKKSYLFIFIVFLSTISYIYFLYMITIPTVIYALFKFFEVYKFNFKKFFSLLSIFSIHYFIGILLGMFSLLPSLVRSFSSSRASIESNINYFHWDYQYYLDFFKGILDVNEIGIYGFISLSCISFIIVIFVLIQKKKDKIFWGQLIIYILAFLIPIFSLLFNGFAGKTLRWCFIFNFWSSMCVVKYFPEFLTIDIMKLKRVFIIIFSYICLYLFIYILTGYSIKSSLIFLVIYTILFIFIKLYGLKSIYIYISLLCFLCIELTLKSYELYSPNGLNYINDYFDSGKVIEQGNYNASSALEMIEDDTIYRTDVVSNSSQRYQQMNYGLRNGLNGISSYYSFSGGNISDYSLELGNSQQNIKFLILNWDQRTALNALSSVKYLSTITNCRAKIPYGYDLIATRERMMADETVQVEYLYENKYELPIMYTYNSYITKEKYSQLDVNEKEQSMLQSAVLEEDIDLLKGNLNFNYETLADKNVIINNLKKLYLNSDVIEIHDDYFIIKEDNVSILLNIDKNIMGELYVIFNDITYESMNANSGILKDLNNYGKRYVLQNLKEKYINFEKNQAVGLEASTDYSDDIGTLLDSSNQYYFGGRDLLLNLGHITSQNITLRFGKPGKYSFSDMKIVSQPMKKYAEQINELKNETIENINIDSNKITGHVNLSRKQLLCLSVPYANGWKAYVNGEEVKIYKTNGMHMGLLLEKGENKIQFIYDDQSFKIGCIVSSLTLIGVSTYLIINKVRRRPKDD